MIVNNQTLDSYMIDVNNANDEEVQLALQAANFGCGGEVYAKLQDNAWRWFVYDILHRKLRR